MKAALKRIGGEIVSEDKLSNGSVRVLLRIGKSKQHQEYWADAVERVLLHLVDPPPSTKKMNWGVDISRYYYASKAEQKVKYLWRLVFTGDLDVGKNFVRSAIIESVSESSEVKSFPLSYVPSGGDPADGRRGVYPLSYGDGMGPVAAAIAGRG